MITKIENMLVVETYLIDPPGAGRAEKFTCSETDR